MDGERNTYRTGSNIAVFDLPLRGKFYGYVKHEGQSFERMDGVLCAPLAASWEEGRIAIEYSVCRRVHPGNLVHHDSD
jgi:hypothetical protein